MPDSYKVRLKPHNPARGHVMRDYTAAPWGKKFKAGVWYTVLAVQAEYLRTITQVYEDPHSGLAFDVVTQEEAEAIQAREEAEALGLVHDDAAEPEPIMPTMPAGGAVTEDRALNQPRPLHELSAQAAVRAAEEGARRAPPAPPQPPPVPPQATAAPKKAPARKKAVKKAPTKRGG